jgi:hypothetical protein
MQSSKNILSNAWSLRQEKMTSIKEFLLECLTNEECTPSQYKLLLQLQERLEIAEAASKLLDSTYNDDPELFKASPTSKQTSFKESSSRVNSLKKITISSFESSKVALLRTKFESNKRSSGQMLTMVSKAFNLRRSQRRPPPRPMTLARGNLRETSRD